MLVRILRLKCEIYYEDDDDSVATHYKIQTKTNGKWNINK